MCSRSTASSTWARPSHCASPLLEAIENDGSGVAVDMRGCSFIDSTGLRILVEAARRLGREGQRLRLIGMSEQPLRVFELTMGGRLELFQLSDPA